MSMFFEDPLISSAEIEVMQRRMGIVCDDGTPPRYRTITEEVIFVETSEGVRGLASRYPFHDYSNERIPIRTPSNFTPPTQEIADTLRDLDLDQLPDLTPSQQAPEPRPSWPPTVIPTITTAPHCASCTYRNRDSMTNRKFRCAAYPVGDATQCKEYVNNA